MSLQSLTRIFFFLPVGLSVIELCLNGLGFKQTFSSVGVGRRTDPKKPNCIIAKSVFYILCYIYPCSISRALTVIITSGSREIAVLAKVE